MCIEGLNRCFGRPAVDPDNHRTSHDEVESKQKPPKSSDGGKHGSPNGPPYPKDSIGRAAASGPHKDVEGVSDQPPDKASQVSAFPKNRGVNTYEYPKETTPKEVPSRTAVKPNNSPIDGSLHGSQPYPEETKLSAKADDDSEKRMQTKVGNKVIKSTGDFKVKEQTKAIDSWRE